MTVIVALVVLVGWIASIVVCFLKGKPWFAFFGIAAVMPLFAVVFIPMVIVGAIRLAKPGSNWWRKYQAEPWKEETARMRFPREALVQDALANRARLVGQEISQLTS
jgi:hypothetical protein